MRELLAEHGAQELSRLLDLPSSTGRNPGVIERLLSDALPPYFAIVIPTFSESSVTLIFLLASITSMLIMIDMALILDC